MNKIIKDENIEHLNLRAVDLFFCKIRELSKNHSEIYIDFSGGNSVQEFYDIMSFLTHFVEKEVWKKIKFCFADERLVQLNSKDSNYKDVKEKLFSHLLEKKIIEEKQIIPINCNAKSVLDDYNKKIPRVDIAILGVGPDGHTCSLFPNHPSIRNEEEKYILVENSPKPPSRRISMSKKMLENVNTSFIFFIGESKADAFRKFNDKTIKIEDCPAKIILKNKNYYVITNLD